MKLIWGKNLEDLVNIAQIHGWIFYLNLGGKHYYYVYVDARAELICFAVEAKQKLEAKYASIDGEGKLVTSDKPIMPVCAKLTEVLKDETFEGLLK